MKSENQCVESENQCVESENQCVESENQCVEKTQLIEKPKDIFRMLIINGKILTQNISNCMTKSQFILCFESQNYDSDSDGASDGASTDESDESDDEIISDIEPPEINKTFPSMGRTPGEIIDDNVKLSNSTIETLEKYLTPENSDDNKNETENEKLFAQLEKEIGEINDRQNKIVKIISDLKKK